MGSYACHWRDYSTLPGPRGRFRYLLLAVRKSEQARSKRKPTQYVSRPVNRDGAVKSPGVV